MTTILENNYPPKGHKVSPRSKADIRNFANKIRGMLSLNDPLLCTEQILDIFAFHELVDYEIVPKSEMGIDIAGETMPGTGLVRIREDVYDKGDTFCRFTICHEIGHSLMHRSQITFARTAPYAPEHKIYEDSEWQANAFAAEFLAPLEYINQYDNVSQIAARFDIGIKSAQLRLKAFNEARRNF